jgi:hypothetical protein
LIPVVIVLVILVVEVACSRWYTGRVNGVCDGEEAAWGKKSEPMSLTV